MQDLFGLRTWICAVAMIVACNGLHAEEKPIRVMSFNIRYGTANDGENAWPKRRGFVVETIQAFAPDLLGTQETLKFQRDELASKLEGYGVFGVGRDDGQDSGEMMAIYYREDRFEMLAGGHFWYSETPAVAGSKSWDSSLPRMATWLKLQDRESPDHDIFYFNTHFDHMGQRARVESAKILRAKIAEISAHNPVIFTGDFNAPEGSEVYKTLFEGEEPIRLVDTFRQLHPDQTDNLGTAGGFTLSSRGRNRIDWIGCSEHFEIRSAEIDRTNRDGVTPSDHFPVTAVIERE